MTATSVESPRDSKIKAGAGWLAWIFLCTWVNVGMQIAHQDTRLVLGVSSVEVVVEVFIGLIGGGIFAVLTKYAVLGKTWAFAVGIFLYSLDTILQLLCANWMGVAIHAWALFSLGGGLKACMMPIPAPAPASPSASTATSPPPVEP
jgi:hypothetical protein